MGLLSTLGSVAGGFLGGPTGGLIGGAIGGFFDTEHAASSANEAAANAASTNRNWQQYMSDTQMQRRVVDLQKAGLNPMLAYSLGGAAVPGGATAATTSADTILNSGYTQQRVANETSLAKAQLSNIQADTENKKATADNIKADTALKAATVPVQEASASRLQQEILNLQQDIKESFARIDQLVKLGRLTDAEASKIRAEIPGIIMQRALITSQIKLNNTSAFSHLVSSNNVGIESSLNSLMIPRQINLANSQDTAWKRYVSPYLDEILGIGSFAASGVGGFIGAKSAGRK